MLVGIRVNAWLQPAWPAIDAMHATECKICYRNCHCHGEGFWIESDSTQNHQREG